jgi:hypothetical protein
MKDVRAIEPGQIWVNNDIPYIISGFILNATDYEETGELPRMICYTQGKDGKLPAGTPYVREEKDFRKNFTLQEE